MRKLHNLRVFWPLPSYVRTITVLLFLLCSYSAFSQPLNTLFTANSPEYASEILTERNGVSPPAITNKEGVISVSTLDYGRISGGLLGTASFTVMLNSSYPANTYAGFEIKNEESLLDLSLLQSLTIEVVNANGDALVSRVGNASLANLNLLSSHGNQVLGFVSPVPFAGVRIIYNAGLVSLTSLRVYGAVLQKFTAGPALNSCNSFVSLTNPDYPVFINSGRSSTGSLLTVNGSVTAAEHIIDNDPATAAALEYVAGVASNKVSVSVKDQITDYQAGTFAGFDIKPSNPLLNLNVLSGLTITTFKDNVQRESLSGNALLVGAGSSLLSGGEGRHRVGFVTNYDFDEVAIKLNDGLLGASLGKTLVYGIVLQKFCAGTLQCNNTFWLNQPDFPVIINSERTGPSGVANVGSISNVSDAISGQSDDFAIINLPVGLLSSASLSVKDVLSPKYPVGTIAGFAIKDMNNLVELTLLSGIRISTFLNGLPAESKSGTDLINLSVLTTLIGPGQGVYNVGFRTTKEFDEIQISYVNTATVLKKLHVFGAFADTRYVNSGNLLCGLDTNPDIAVTNISVPVQGNVATNDDSPGGVQYSNNGIPVSAPPASSPTFHLNPDGSYIFISTTPGVYQYAISICEPGYTGTCPVENLSITVMDPESVNGPVINADISVVFSGEEVVIPALANDKNGTNGAAIDKASLVLQTGPTQGTANIDPVTGNISYTSSPGFTGTEKIKYRVCDLNNHCGVAEIKIKILPAGGSKRNAASADYYASKQNKMLAGNVAVNDRDPLGAAPNITFLDAPTSNQGTLNANNDGSFNFVPHPSFRGPLQLRYRSSDNATPPAISVETLHLLYDAGYPDLTPSITLSNANFAANAEKNFLVKIFELNQIPTSAGSAMFSVFIPVGYQISFDGNISTIDLANAPGVSVQNSQWSLVLSQLGGRKLTFQMKSGFSIGAGEQVSLGFKLKRTTANSNTAPVITVNVVDDTQMVYDHVTENNIYTRVINSL